MALPNANSNFIMQPSMPGPLSEERFAQNGDVPSSVALRRAAWQQNHVAMHQRKQLFSYAYSPLNTPAPAGTSATELHFCFRTGEAIDKVRMIIGMAPGSAAAGSIPGDCILALLDGATTIFADAVQHAKVDVGLLYTPSDVLWAVEEIDLSDGLLPNTVYRGQINQRFYARISSVTIYEVGAKVALSSDDGIANPLRYEADKPIYSAGIQDLAETGGLLYNHNGAQLISWSAPTVATAPSLTNVAYKNIMSAATAYSASAPGFVLNTQYHDTLRSGGVNVELAVYATRTSGTGSLDIQLQNSAGTVLTETTITGASSPCHTSTHLITALASDKTDILARVGASTTWRIDAIALWEYEA